MLLGYNAVQFGESLMFQRKIWPTSSGLKNELSKKPAEAGGRLN
jgi:hypothetical protein